MSQHQAKFLTGNLTRHITVMSLTSAMGILALFVVDAIDMIFISMLGVAELAAAVGFAGAIQFVTTSISLGIGIAGGALVAKALGQGQEARAREILTHVMVVGVILSCLVAAMIFANLRSLTGLVGAKGVTQDLAVAYLRILVPTMPVMMVGILGSAALRSHGAAGLSMMVTLIAGIANAVLDPIFIFALDLGLNGAAIASVLSRFAMAGTALWYLHRSQNGLIFPSLPNLLRDVRPIAAIAIPAILANVATPIGSAYVTRVAADFGESAVAGMAIIGRLTPIAFALIFAMSGAIGPIIGQNFGAGRHDRVHEAFNRSILLIVLYVIPVVGLLFVLRTPIADVFKATGTARDLIFLFCGPLSLAWIFNGVIFIANAAYNNLGHPMYSTWVNWGRNTIGVFPFVYFGAQAWGASGVLIGQMTGGLFVAIASFLLAQHVMRKAEKLQAPNDGPGVVDQHFMVAHHRK